MTTETDDIKIKLSPYLGCSKKLIEFFAIIGYEEEALKRSAPNFNKNLEKLDLTFLSIVISDFPYDLADDYIIKQVYPDKPSIIKSGRLPKFDSIIFSSCIDSQTGDKKIFNSCYALRFYEKIETRTGEIYYVPKAFLIYSQYPYFSTFSRICDKILISSDEAYNDKDFPIEIFIHCLVNYFPSPINHRLVLKDFTPNIIIPKLTGYPYADFNLGKILSSVNLNDFIKIFILIFLELDLLFFSPNLEKLNLFMFSLYILNYPLTDSNYFWHIKTISINDIQNGDDTVNTSFKGVNSELTQDLDLTDFKALNFLIDLENKKQPIMSIGEDKEAKEINSLLKFINGILNKGSFAKKCTFFYDCLLKLQKKLKNILKEYNEKTENNSNIAESFFYINTTVMSINRLIQEAFYDFILNILVELNKDYILDPSLQYPVIKKEDSNPKLCEEEKIFLAYSRNTIKYNTYFENFISDFKVFEGMKVSLLFSDEYVNLKKQESYKGIEEKVSYFEIMDKLYVTKRKDLVYDLKALDTEYSKKNYIPSNKAKHTKKNTKLFDLNKDIIRKFIYKKKNKAYYEVLEEPEEINVESENKNSLTFTIQYYFSSNGLLKANYFIRGSAEYIISIFFPLFSSAKLPNVLKEYLLTSKKMNYFQRYNIFLILKSINKYYRINKEKVIFPEINYNNVQKYYEIIQNHLKENSIIQDEEIFTFFRKHFATHEEQEKIDETDTGDFSYTCDDKNYILEINKVLKLEETEIIFTKGKEIIKFKKLANQNISDIFQEMYSYYEFFLSQDFKVVNFDINKMNERIANLIFIFLKIKDEQNMVDLLIYLLHTMIDFKNKLAEYQNNQQ